MFEATITNKTTADNGSLKVEVTFSDGVSSFVETVIPQDINGLSYFIKNRLIQLNLVASPDIPLGKFTPPVVTPPVVDAAKADWLAKVSKLGRIKVLLIDTGVFTGSEKEVTDLRNEVLSGYNSAYLG